MELPEAVSETIEECIQKDVLKDFLLEQKAEVIAMSIYEYNEEYARKSLMEMGYEQGLEDGRKTGIEESRKVGIKILVKSVDLSCKI